MYVGTQFDVSISSGDGCNSRVRWSAGGAHLKVGKKINQLFVKYVSHQTVYDKVGVD